MTGVELDLGRWLAAAAPIGLLLALVVSGRLGAKPASVVVLAAAVLVAVVGFEAGAAVIAVALGKGVWLGLWILLVVWPALLLYRVAAVGGLERIGAIFASVLPDRRANLLVVAWVFPSFVQGVAGFGTPIAIAAPLLVAMGYSRVRAVVYPLLGYHWSVTFGSMGSSFYMASLTGGFGLRGEAALATLSAGLLAMLCLSGGLVVLLLDGGLRAVVRTWRTWLVVGVAMATTLVLVARAVPAVASLASGAAGFAAVAVLAVLARRRRPAVRAAVDGPSVDGPPLDGPPPASPVVVLAPYLALLVLVLPVFLVPATGSWVREHLILAPAWPGTATGLGWSNPPVDDHVPLPVLGHPGTYILLACLLGVLVYRRAGLWRGEATAGLVTRWARSLPSASVSILVLACLAMVMVDTGMIALLAAGAATAGPLYPALAPVVGALGSFMTGSTTSSNALFAPLQADIAVLLELPPELLVAAQTAGGNVGNAIAPVVVLIGATAVGAPEDLSRILRRCLGPAACLLALVSAVVLVLALRSGA